MRAGISTPCFKLSSRPWVQHGSKGWWAGKILRSLTTRILSQNGNGLKTWKHSQKESENFENKLANQNMQTVKLLTDFYFYPAHLPRDRDWGGGCRNCYGHNFNLFVLYNNFRHPFPTRVSTHPPPGTETSSRQL